MDVLSTEHHLYDEPMIRSPLLVDGHIQVEYLQQKVDELNLKSQKQYAKRKNGTAIIDPKHPVVLTLYRNGLVISGLPYYPYFCKEAQVIMQDIVDCFFPSALKGKYFECTPMVLVDETERVYVPQIRQLMGRGANKQ